MTNKPKIQNMPMHKHIYDRLKHDEPSKFEQCGSQAPTSYTKACQNTNCGARNNSSLGWTSYPAAGQPAAGGRGGMTQCLVYCNVCEHDTPQTNAAGSHDYKQNSRRQMIKCEHCICANSLPSNDAEVDAPFAVGICSCRSMVSNLLLQVPIASSRDASVWCFRPWDGCPQKGAPIHGTVATICGEHLKTIALSNSTL